MHETRDMTLPEVIIFFEYVAEWQGLVLTVHRWETLAWSYAPYPYEERSDA